MGRVKFILFLVFVVFLLFGCTTKYYADYDLDLVNVVRDPAIAKGEKVVIKKDTSYYEDNYITIQWKTVSGGLGFVLSNKSLFFMSIPWEKAAFVDNEGFSHKGGHLNIYADEIPLKARTKDAVYPAGIGKIKRSGIYADSLLPKVIEGGTQQEAMAIIKSHIGKNYRVLLPLSIKDKENIYYIFDFKIKDAKLKKEGEEEDKSVGGCLKETCIGFSKVLAPFLLLALLIAIWT